MVNWLKQISAPATTTADIFAGDVLNWVIQYHNDVDLASGDPAGVVHILTETVFNSGKLKFYDSNKSHDITFTMPDFSENKTITLPTTWATSDEIVGRTSAMTITGKSIDGGSNALSNIPKSALPSDTLYGASGHAGGSSYLVYKDAADANKIKARNTDTGTVVATHATDAGALLNSLHTFLVNGDTVMFETDTYTGSTNYTNTNRQRIHYIGNGATIQGFKFIFSGTDWLTIRGWCVFRDLYFNGGSGQGATTGVQINDSFAPTFEHCMFFYCDSAVEIGCATNFVEFAKFSNCHFSDNRKSITFKTPTGTGSGSYINSVLDHCSFNSSTVDQTANYTFIEIQDNAIVSEGKWTNLRFWFADTGHVGVGIDVSGDCTRCQLVKPVFENFSGVTGTIGIRYNAAMDAGFHFEGRPVFMGSGSWSAKLSNANTRWTLGSVSAWRESGSVTVGVSNTYGAVTTNSNVADFEGLPCIYATIGGTVGTTETVTIETKISTIADNGTNTYTIEKPYTRAGTYLLTIADYINLTTNNHFYIMKDMQTRAKTSLASTSATVTIGAVSAIAQESMMDGKTLINSTIEGYERLSANKYYARYLGGAANSEGQWIGRTTADTVGTGTSVASAMDADGPHRASSTGATIGNMVSIRCNSNATARRDFNPILLCKFKLLQITATRAFIGWTSNTSAVTSVSDPLNALTGIGLWLDTAVSPNWKIKHNAGTGASTEVNTGVAADTSVHTLKIIADNATPRFTIMADNGSYITSTNVTTPIPAATTALLWYSWIEATAAASKTYHVYYAEQETNINNA